MDNRIANKAINYYINRLKGIKKARNEHRYHQIDETLITKAIDDIKKGMSKCAASRKYGVSRQTIYRYIKNSKEAIQR